jgi:hypothetical protein
MMNVMNKIIYVYCDGGLGNRINSLICGYSCLSQQKYELQIIWPVNRWCMASFDDIFQTKTHRFVDSSFTEIQQYSKENNQVLLFSHENQFCLSPSKFHNLYSFWSLKHFQESISSVMEQSLQPIIYSSQLPGFLTLEIIEFFLDNFSFSSKISGDTEKFLTANKLTTSNFYGIHLRATDTGRTLSSFDPWLKMIEKQKAHRFFVCSDDSSIEKQISSLYRNVIINQKRFYIKKAEENKSWCENTIDEDGRSFAYNIFRDKEAVIEGCIDLLILSKSYPIITSRSSFLTLAIIMSQHKTHNLRIIVHLLLIQTRWFIKSICYRMSRLIKQ